MRTRVRRLPFRMSSLTILPSAFDLDSQAGSASSPPKSSQQSSAADLLAANTKANSSSTAPGTSPAVGLDSADVSRNTRRGQSRSPSFTLPNSRRSSAAGDRSREGVREEMRNRDDAMNVDGEDAIGDEDNDEDLDPEARANKAAFARKRNAHYGNEAEA